MMLVVLLAVGAARDPAIERAVEYLAREVPRWHRENQCYSCHNNGDAARALYAAARAGYRVPDAALGDTTKWVAHPERWDGNPGKPAFSDKNLARIQFAAALVEAIDAGLVRDRAALGRAATALLRGQKADGSWQVDSGGAVGSPATYGSYLATYMARRTLERAALQAGALGRDYTGLAADAMARANSWFRAARPSATLDRAALLLALRVGLETQRDAILKAQNPDGGWGPFRNSPSEPFDTAVVLLALREGDADAVARGRAWLMKSQLPGGDWLETTRPAGSQSYAEHISTAGWTVLALLATER
jgi:hypothetical protein